MTDQENAADASEFREECRRDQEAQDDARRHALGKRLASQLAALPPDGGRVRDPETQYVYRADPQLGQWGNGRQWRGGWLLHPVCRERYVDGDCPYPVQAKGRCNLHHHRHLRQEAGALECAMDAPREAGVHSEHITIRLPLELQLRCSVAAGRAGLANSTAQWVRGALEAACSLSESMADPQRNPQFQPAAPEKHNG